VRTSIFLTPLFKADDCLGLTKKVGSISRADKVDLNKVQGIECLWEKEKIIGYLQNNL
jgi:hypothetical protein